MSAVSHRANPDVRPDDVSGVSDMVARCGDAWENFIDSLMEQFRLSRPQAEHVLTLFIRVKAVKLDPIMGRYNLTHGGFWDKPVIKRALATPLPAVKKRKNPHRAAPRRASLTRLSRRSNYTSADLRRGARVEMEHARHFPHGKKAVMARKIARDHLREGSTYYRRLAKMERDMKARRKNPSGVAVKTVRADGLSRVLVKLNGGAWTPVFQTKDHAEALKMARLELKMHLGTIARRCNPPGGVPETILMQLGGGKFLAMTGSDNLSASRNSLQMRLRRNKSGANFLVIELTPQDDYTMVFTRATVRSRKIVKQIEGVYHDQLQHLFTHVTGLDTHL